MSEGFAYHRIVDAAGRPCDDVFLEINEAFTRLTGLEADQIIGKRVTAALPGIEKDPTDWIGKYGEVASTGKPVQFENHAVSLQRWYSVSAFSPGKGFFACTFAEITERKGAEDKVSHQTQVLAGTNRIFREALNCDWRKSRPASFGGRRGSDRQPVRPHRRGHGSSQRNRIAIEQPGRDACRMLDRVATARNSGMVSPMRGIDGRVPQDCEGFFTTSWPPPRQHRHSNGPSPSRSLPGKCLLSSTARLWASWRSATVPGVIDTKT